MVAYEPNLDSCLMMHLSRERTIFACYQLFKQLRNRYGMKPVFTDVARWYNDACRGLRLHYQVYGTEMKNLMERFIQHIKDRTECVSMTIFHVEGKQIVTNKTRMELTEIIRTVPLYWDEQETVHDVLGYGWWLS